jgi:hypothetical protein
MPPGGLSKLCPLDSRHRQPIRIVLLYVCWRVENGRPSEEKLIRDKVNLEALTVNQVKVSKLWQTGKTFSLEQKREVANRCHMRAFRCHLLFTFRR